MRINFYTTSRHLRVTPVEPSNRLTFPRYSPMKSYEQKDKKEKDSEETFKKVLERISKKGSFSSDEKEGYRRRL